MFLFSVTYASSRPLRRLFQSIWFLHRIFLGWYVKVCPNYYYYYYLNRKYIYWNLYKCTVCSTYALRLVLSFTKRKKNARERERIKSHALIKIRETCELPVERDITKRNLYYTRPDRVLTAFRGFQVFALFF